MTNIWISMSLIIQGSRRPHSTYTYTSKFYMVFRDELKYTRGGVWAVGGYHVVWGTSVCGALERIPS